MDSIEGFHEQRHLLVALDAAEALFGAEESGGAPAEAHVAVAPPLHASGDLGRDTQRALDRIGRIRSAQPAGHKVAPR